MSRSLGVSDSKADIDSGAINGATVGVTTPAAGKFTTLTSTGNTAIGDAVGDTIALYGVTPVAQRAGAAQATSLVGTASSADVTTDLKAAIIEIQNCLQAIGIWKGAA